MNHTAIAAAFLALALAFYGGMRLEQSNQLRLEQVADRAADKVAMRAAVAISEIEIKNTTINKTIEKHISTEIVYTECKHSDETFNLIKGLF